MQRFLILYCYKEEKGKNDIIEVFGYSSLWSKDLVDIENKVLAHIRRANATANPTLIYASNMSVSSPSIVRRHNKTGEFNACDTSSVPQVLLGIHQSHVTKKGSKKGKWATVIKDIVDKGKAIIAPTIPKREHELSYRNDDGKIKFFTAYQSGSYLDWMKKQKKVS